LVIGFVELHIAGDFGSERSEGVRESGGVEALAKLLGDGATAKNFPAFENEGLEATLREIESGDESVVAAADESYALSEGHD
jgi:hypothetical protein